MQEEGVIRFYQLLQQRIESVLMTRFRYQHLSGTLLHEIYKTIKDIIRSVFENSSYKLSPEATSWLAAQYFKAVKINDTDTADDYVVMNEYTLTELTYHDIELMHNLFTDTTIGPMLEEEYHKRSIS